MSVYFSTIYTTLSVTPAAFKLFLKSTLDIPPRLFDPPFPPYPPPIPPYPSPPSHPGVYFSTMTTTDSFTPA